MTMSWSDLLRGLPLTLALGIGAVAGCSRFDQLAPGAEEAGVARPVLQLELSDRDAPPGARIAVGLRLGAGAGAAIGFAGYLTFDTGALRYLGQPAPAAPFTIVNPADAERGSLRLALLEPGGLASLTPVLVFEVLRGDYADGLGFLVEAAVDRELEPLLGWEVTRGLDRSLRPGDAPPRRLALADWLAWAGDRYPAPAGDRPALAPGDGSLYGDIDFDGAITIFDAYGVANAGVGNFALSDATKDYVVAANVVPFNLPGLGEASDAVPPGLEADGSRLITLFDAAAISTDAVNCAAYPIGACPPGRPGNQPIVGEPVPGRVAPVERVVVTGDVAAGRRFTRDTIYELQGLVRVPFGVTLTIDAGTRIEGDQATRGSLLVARGGRLLAAGTLVEPIVFTCTEPLPGPGCWGGLVINGFALLNTEYSGPGPVPVCPEKTAPGTSEAYGGCLVQDDSGVLRYVRIEHAGQPFPGMGSQPGLSLNGVGSGTVLRLVQVLGGSGDGIAVSGGRAWMRELLLTQNHADGLRWDDGWQGKVQNLVVFRTAGSGSAIRGSNSTTDPDAGPRSSPVLYNVSIVEGNSANTPTAPAVLLERGTAGWIRNLVVLGWAGTGLEIQGAESCARTADSLDVAFGVWWANAEHFSSDTDCVDEAAFATDPSRDNLLLDPDLRDVATTISPDFRPRPGSPAATGSPPPADGFFDPTLTYRGGAPIATAAGSTVPWFLGWTKGF